MRVPRKYQAVTEMRITAPKRMIPIQALLCMMLMLQAMGNIAKIPGERKTVKKVMRSEVVWVMDAVMPVAPRVMERTNMRMTPIIPPFLA